MIIQSKITEADIAITEAKFKLWDSLLAEGKAASDEAKRLIKNDPTVFAYAYLRDEDGKPFRFTAYQDKIANAKHDMTSMCPNRYVIFKAANQIGKSQLLVALTIYHIVVEDNINVVLVSKSLPQSQFLLGNIKQMLNRSTFGQSWRESLGDTANTTMLTFTRNEGKVINRIICAPSGEGILGYPVHYLYLDEADFYEDAKKFFYGPAMNRTNKTKGQIIIFTNPNPEISRNASLLYELWHGELFQQKFSYNFLDAPWNTKEEYDRLKRSIPSYISASTLDGEFPPDGGGFFTQREIDDMMQKEWHNTLPYVDAPIFIGLDLAKVKDNSVMVLGILSPNKQDSKLSDLEIKYMYKFPSKTDYDVVINKLAEVIEYYKNNFKGVANVGFDATGVGKAIEDMIRMRGIKATPVVFSLQSKSRMYANFKMLAEQRRIKIVEEPDCRNQLGSLVFSRTSSGLLQVKHEKEQMHDDFPDAICALIDVSIMPSKVPVTATFVASNAEKPKDLNTRTNNINDYIAKTVRDNNSWNRMRNPYR